MHRLAQGQWVEGQVATWLEARGLCILERNYRVPGGELDVIAVDPEGVVVFVEIRSRGVDQPGLPEESVGPRKRSFLRRAATRWLVEQDRWERVAVRFDVVAVDTRIWAANELPEIEEIRWIPDAFGAAG